MFRRRDGDQPDPPQSSTSSGGGGICICERSDLADGFHLAKRKDAIASVLAKIEKIYSRAKVLNDVLPSVWCSCVGLLAPNINIILNFLIYKGAAALVSEGQEEAGRGMVRGPSMVQRSLDGLITFLTCLFPYLPDAEALAYLDAADADPLVAALLIIDRRGLTRESFITEAGLEIALRSAAVAARHPDPEGFMRGWKLVSLCPQEFVEQLAVKRDSPEENVLMVTCLTNMLCGSSADLRLADGALWELAGNRRPSWKEVLPRLPSVRATIKRLLLSMIHGFYLKALGALPKKELTDWCHRSLLLGGHCYGPLDPVSNIIVNTIWYEQTFPAREALPQVNMISTDCLWRIAARSLYGLVSFLRSRYPNLTPDQALQRLLEVRAQLSLADPLLQKECTITSRKLRKEFGLTMPCTTLTEAYVAAATAAFHPSPHLQKDFLGKPDSVCNLRAISDILSLHDDQPILEEKFKCLLILVKSPSCVGMLSHVLEPMRISKRVYAEVLPCKAMFWSKHKRVISMVTEVLDKYNEIAVPKYNLHVICGVNELVDQEPGLDPDFKCYNPCPYKYHYSHINFLATCEGSSSATLFFAECSNDGTRTSWCVPVPLQPDAGICTMADIHPESRPGVGMRPEPCVQPDAGICTMADVLSESRSGVGMRPETGVQPDAGAGIHSEHPDAGMCSGAGIRSESGPDAGAEPDTGMHPGAYIRPEAGRRRGPGIRPEAARCIYCENEGSRILHPITKGFHGRDDFKELSGGGFYTNDLLIQRETVDWVRGVEDDVIYGDYCVYADAEVDAADGDVRPLLRW